MQLDLVLSMFLPKQLLNIMTKQDLVNLYNKYLLGELNNNQEEGLWEGIYNYSSSFLCYIRASEETKQDALEDLIYDLMTMDSYFKRVNTFHQLRSVFVSKLKAYARKYNNWENKEQSYGKDQTKI